MDLRSSLLKLNGFNNSKKPSLTALFLFTTYNNAYEIQIPSKSDITIKNSIRKNLKFQGTVMGQNTKINKNQRNTLQQLKIHRN